MFFNVLFITIIFQLKGTLNLKLGLLSLGNLIGLGWNFVFMVFVVNCGPVFVQELGSKIAGIGYVILFPFLNILWVVSYWSLSLTFFSKPARQVDDAV
jgi:hypothetical protein